MASMDICLTTCWVGAPSMCIGIVDSEPNDVWNILFIMIRDRVSTLEPSKVNTVRLCPLNHPIGSK